MRAWVIVSFVIAAVLLAAGSTGASSAPPRSLEFNTTLLQSSTLDIGKKGRSAGDTTIKRWRLTDRHGRAIGTGHEVCQFTSAYNGVCYGVYELPLGNIAFSSSYLHTMAVTGGTESYAGASGQLAREGRTVRGIFT